MAGPARPCRLSLLLVAMLGGAGLLGSAGLAQAQAPDVGRLSKAVDDASVLGGRVYAQLHPADRILQMRVARGAITGLQSLDMLRKRADDLAKGTVTDAMQRSEEQQEAKLYFDAIERAAASAQWPSLQRPEYYRAYAAVVLERVRAEHTDALKNNGNAAQPLEDAYQLLMLTRGREQTGLGPFAIPSSRISSAMDMPNSSVIAPATSPPTRLEFDVRRAGPDIGVMQLPTPSLGQCQSACQKDARCRGFSFQYPADAGQNGVCSLKSSVAPPQADACCVSWVKQ